MRIVVDSYAWVEIFAGTERGEKVKGYLAEADEVYTPDLVLAEISRKCIREGLSEEETRERLLAIKEASLIAHIDIDIALEAARCDAALREGAKREGLKEPGLFDAIVLATARVKRSRVATGDEHFKGLEETIWVG